MSRAWPLLLAASLLAACSTTPPWRPGIALEDERAQRGHPRDPAAVEVFFKPEIGVGDEVDHERLFMCGSTTVLRRAFALATPGTPAPPDRDWEVVGTITTEEFPRDERTSVLEGDTTFKVFGIGTEPWELFEVRLDPRFREPALRRLRAYAAHAGADAVIDAYATGEAEHHMWIGSSLGFDAQTPHSPLYTNARLIQLRLRDVRLHGTAIRYVD